MESLFINSLIVLACCGYFAARGYENGVIRTIQRACSAVSAYVACYFFTGFVADLISRYSSWQGGVAYFAAALLLFVSVTILVQYLLESVIEHLEEREIEPAQHAGLMAGFVLGSLLGLLAVWTLNILYDAYEVRRGGAASLQARELDPVRRLAGGMVGGTVRYAIQHKTDDQLTPAVAAELTSDPVGVSKKIMAMSNSDSVKLFFGDRAIQEMLEQNRFDDIAQQQLFKNMMLEPANREALEILSSAVKNADQLTPEQRSIHLLADIWQKGQRLVRDPRFQALSEKPEYRALLANPSAPALMASPVMGELADILFSAAPPLSPVPVMAPPAERPTPGPVEAPDRLATVERPRWEAAPPANESEATEDEAGRGAVIYRWTDEKGRVHFSENKPEGIDNVQATPLRE